MFTRTAPRQISYDIIFEEIRKRTTDNDAITVAVSLFNYASFIEECLSSIANQRHEHIELIVVDDHSTNDRSIQVAETWIRRNRARFDRVSLLRHSRNQGLAEARNTAFYYSRTDPIFVIDADNQIYPRALSRLYEFVRYREFDAAYTQLEFFGDQKRLGYADIWSKDQFRTGNYVDAMSLISKRSWEQVGGFSHIEGGWEDFEFWCKFVDAGMKGVFVPEILCRYRVHGSSMLRTETLLATERLAVDLTIRHPWISLGKF